MVYGPVKHQNRRIAPDYFAAYKTQDMVPEGTVGVCAVSLIMTETMDNEFFFNITHKIFNTIIPWLFRIFSKMDKGIALLDPDRFHEHHKLTPASLVDPFGSPRDADGTPCIEHYRTGAVTRVHPSKRINLDYGHFLYEGAKGDMPSLTGTREDETCSCFR